MPGTKKRVAVERRRLQEAHAGWLDQVRSLAVNSGKVSRDAWFRKCKPLQMTLEPLRDMTADVLGGWSPQKSRR